MQNIVNQNIKILIDSLNMTAIGFAKSIGYKRADNIYNCINNRTNPSVELIQNIARNYKYVSIKWLLTGDGHMFIETTNNQVSEEKPEHFSNNNITNNHINVNSLSQNGLRLYYENQRLKSELEMLKSQLLDKDKIIQLLENQLNNN